MNSEAFKVEKTDINKGLLCLSSSCFIRWQVDGKNKEPYGFYVNGDYSNDIPRIIGKAAIKGDKQAIKLIINIVKQVERLKK